MTRNLKGSLLIASMLVVAWTTSSEACHRRRALPAQPVRYYQSGYSYAEPHGLLRSPRAATARLAAGYYGGGYPGGTAGYPGGSGTTSVGPATTRAASAGRRPG